MGDLFSMKIRKIKHKKSSVKFFGFKDEGEARLCGRWGKKRSYGHFCCYSDNRTKAEIRNADDRKLNKQDDNEKSI